MHAQFERLLIECSSCTGCDLLIAWGRGEDGQLGDHIPSRRHVRAGKRHRLSSLLCVH